MPSHMGGFTRREVLRFLSWSGAALLAGPLIGSCAEPTSSATLALARETGFLRIGFADERPYAWITAAGTVTGQAPEVAREVLRRLGVPGIEGVLTEFGSLIPDLKAGRFDLIAAGMFVTPERCGEILFSDPDYCTQQSFLVEAGNPLRLGRYEDVVSNPEARLGVVIGGVEVAQAEESGIPGRRVVAFDTADDLVGAVRDGLVDAAVLTTITLEALDSDGGLEGLEATAAFTFDNQQGCGAFGFRMEDGAFRDEFNGVLQGMKTAGELVPIVAPFGFAAAAEAAKDQRAEDLCEG